MANFIGLVYATLKNEGIDTKGMSTDEAVEKYNELKGKGEGTPAEQRKMQDKDDWRQYRGTELTFEQEDAVDEAVKMAGIYKHTQTYNLTIDDIFEVLEEDNPDLLKGNKGKIEAYVRGVFDILD